MTKLLSTLSSIFLTGCTVFGIRTAEQPSYQLLHSDSAFEIRQYPVLVVAETTIAGDYQTGSREGFQRLASYIFGNNRRQQQITMTAPVVQEPLTETLSMTAPVIQQNSGGVWMMAFVLPKEITLANAPLPLDSEVVIKELPAKKIAVSRYSGRLSAERIAEKSAALQKWLAEHDYKVISTARSAAYDPPWTLPFLRRNEIHIDIE